MADEKSSSTATAAGWLAGGLVTLTTALTAIGGLTGGLARMFRNSGNVLFFPAAVRPFALILVAIVLAIVASVWDGAGASGSTSGTGGAGGAGGKGETGKPAGEGGPGGQGGAGAPGGAGGAGGEGGAGGQKGGAGGSGGPPGEPVSKTGWRRWVPAALLSVGGALFAVGVLWAIDLMIVSAGVNDQPSLSAQVVPGSSGGWTLKGAARSSGLAVDEKMQVYVYALPQKKSDCSSVAPTSGSTTTGATPATSGSPTASESSQPLWACGTRLFYVVTGPDQDGVAAESFEIPLPIDADTAAFVVTANLGDFARTCQGIPFAVQDKPHDPTPSTTTATTVEQDAVACMTFLPPTAVATTTTITVQGPPQTGAGETGAGAYPKHLHVRIICRCEDE